MSASTEFDVIVIGGGPAGSTAANYLTQGNARVLVLEREVFPRFHIGESLLPCDLPIFEALGVRLDPSEYRLKGGAEFIDERTGEHRIYPFAEGLAGTPGHAYQVERAKFDKMLLDRARELGASVLEGVAVREVELHDASVAVNTVGGSFSARYLVDASGQDAFLARRDRSVEPISGFGRAAVFTHFSELSDAALSLLGSDGNIKVLVVPDGWFWVIPLAGRRLSVGLVKRSGKVTAELLDAEIGSSRLLSALASSAVRGPTHILGNFSFKNSKPSGPRWVCIGDAGCFLDPVFSSGVSLAMLGAEHMSSLLLTALAKGEEAEPRLMSSLEAHMQRAYVSFGSLIHSFYQRNIVQNLFFAEDPELDIRAGLISLLAGDVWRTDNRFQSMLLRANRWTTPATSSSDATPLAAT